MKSKTRFMAMYSLFVALVLAFTCFSFASISTITAQAETSSLTLSGDGSEANPYLITNLEELELFRDNVNGGNNYAGKYIKLTDNIDLSSIQDWTPIGNATNNFLGYFDGNDKTVSNLSVLGNNKYAGFFGYIKGKSMAETTIPSVKNLTLSNVSVSGDYYVGGLSGQGYTCRISGVTVSGNVSGTRYIGGLIGHVYTYFNDCHFNGYVSCSFDALGGIAGAGDGRFYDCSVIGAVSGSNWVGGVIGNGQEGTSAVGCYVKATVSTNSNYYFGIGGIAGVGGHGYSVSKFENNYFDGEVFLEGQKVNAIVTGLINADSNEDIKTTVSGNSWNTEYYDVNTPVLVVAEVDRDATPEEWAAGANENLTTTRNNNLVVLESDIKYVDAKNVNEVTIIDVSKFDSTLPTIEQELIEQKVVENSKVAEINGSKFTSFADALAFTKNLTGDVVVKIYDKVTLNENISGSFDSIKFIGTTEKAEIYLDVQGYITANGKKVEFENLTLSKASGGYITNAGFMNVAFGIYQAEEVYYTNCILANGAYAASSKVNFTNCTFKKSYDKYGLWAYGNTSVTVDACIFDNYRGIKLYDEGKGTQNDTIITVKNTDFSSLVGEGSKPAIVLTYGQSVTLQENTYSNTGVFELDLDGKPNGAEVSFVDSDEKLTCFNDNGACGVLVNEKIYISVTDALSVANKGDVITLLHDSSEAVEFPADVIIDYNGFTAENVKNEALQIANIKTERNAEDNATTITITYTNSEKITSFVIQDGKDGTNGVNGKDGINGINGTNGKDGKDGVDGLGIKSIEISDSGELLITYTDNSKINLGVVVGANGLNGNDGVNGTNGKDSGVGLAITATVISGIALFLIFVLFICLFFKGAKKLNK